MYETCVVEHTNNNTKYNAWIVKQVPPNSLPCFIPIAASTVSHCFLHNFTSYRQSMAHKKVFSM